MFGSERRHRHGPGCHKGTRQRGAKWRFQGGALNVCQWSNKPEEWKRSRLMTGVHTIHGHTCSLRFFLDPPGTTDGYRGVPPYKNKRLRNPNKRRQPCRRLGTGFLQVSTCSKATKRGPCNAKRRQLIRECRNAGMIVPRYLDAHAESTKLHGHAFCRCCWLQNMFGGEQGCRPKMNRSACGSC
jgi:hypothetical protein